MSFAKLERALNDTGQQQKTRRIVGAFAHERRLKILLALATGEKSVGDLTRLLRIELAAASTQLSILRAADLVVERREGASVRYKIDRPEVINLALAALSLIVTAPEAKEP